MIPYGEAPREQVKLPERKKIGKYQSPNYPINFIPNCIRSVCPAWRRSLGGTLKQSCSTLQKSA